MDSANRDELKKLCLKEFLGNYKGISEEGCRTLMRRSFERGVMRRMEKRLGGSNEFRLKEFIYVAGEEFRKQTRSFSAESFQGVIVEGFENLMETETEEDLKSYFMLHLKEILKWEE